ncbi:MAG TPA: DUF2914 domain-containing protein [Thermodesulfobacteriota bacterium]|nr:DUF2914 domain-containing protein [Thermodesulfobacteriota bacterium]
MKKHGAGILILVLMVIAVCGMVLPVCAQEKAKPEGAPKEAGSFAVKRLVVGTGVENGEPVGAAETFPASTEKVYCFLEATDIAKDTEVSFVWFSGDKELSKFSVPLKEGPRWRTYAYKNLREMKGDWKVEVRDSEGKVVKDVKFKVE